MVYLFNNAITDLQFVNNVIINKTKLLFPQP